MVLRETLFRLSQEPHLRDFAMHNRLGRGMARRFVAGETVEEGLAVVRSLQEQGMTATLDLLGENVSSQEEAAAATETFLSLVDSMHSAGIPRNVSLKLTALGLDLGVGVAQANLSRILERASELDGFIRIDMESSEYVDRTLDVCLQVATQSSHVGTVIQACLYRSESDLERLIDAGVRVRLVKGAYLEPPELAYQAKADVDRNFIRLMQHLLRRGSYPAIATHDPRMIDATRAFANGLGIDAGHFEFQMLYGIRRDLQAGLMKDGYGMRVYVPFGAEWFPYLMRRMAERPANLMFVVGNIVREARTRDGYRAKKA